MLEILRVIIEEGVPPPSGHSGVQAQRRTMETEETIEEQGWLARIVHLIQSPDNDRQYQVCDHLVLGTPQGIVVLADDVVVVVSLSAIQLLQQARKSFADGNERVKFTTPPLITSALKLARRYKTREHYEDNWSSQSSSLYKFMHNALSTLYGRVNGAAGLCLRLFLACGQVSDQTGFEEVSYEFFTQAFTIYEESISDSRAQFQAVCVIAGALHPTRGFSRENYDTLITKCALHGSKLLKKPDQCRAVYLASHLWWSTEIPGRVEEDGKTVCLVGLVYSFFSLCMCGWKCVLMMMVKLYRDGKRVLECLQRALRVADACMDVAVSVELFVEILNRYVYHFDQQNDAVIQPFFFFFFFSLHLPLSILSHPLIPSFAFEFSNRGKKGNMSL